MTLTIVALVVSGLLALNYIITRFYTDHFWSSMGRIFATLSYIIFTLLVFFRTQNPIHPAFGLIVIAQVLALIAGELAEKKDYEKENLNYFIGSIIIYASYFVVNYIALTLLVGNQMSLVPVLVCAGIAVVVSALTCLGCKLSKLDLQGLHIHTLCFLFIVNFLTALTIWYTIIIPDLLWFAVYIGILFLSNYILLKVNFGKRKGKTAAFIIHRSLFFIAESFLLIFVYYDLIQFTNF